MPRKTLITEARVLEAVRAGQQTLAVPPDALITPLARDTARARGLAFVVTEPAARTCACEHPSPTPERTHRVALGSDHGGFAYKRLLHPFLQTLGWQVLDVGTDSEQNCDYPDFAFAVARAVTFGQADFGIMIDGAGLGSAMVCNKVPGIRAACAYNEFTAWNARAHNDANVLTLGSRTLGIEVCKRIVQVFLETPFEGGRHAARVQKLTDIEAHFASDRG
ncbi:ribose 5-phosphate isomerase B [Rhodocaloribacter litoris]|uniref:ribose 5-phosphate isomerase B n=1 Tax=Rhodocaloribacter litoris TaxID=2558931 RepID=UPI001421E7C4|nr:ribose 5-phosphate isomerase B [Rhodocaloribacter litoris]QXD14722.1 ribose 5-phosphate isomerase B [Rhodocaloribacter litoris]